MISHKHKFIMISPPRAGNTSFLLRIYKKDIISNKLTIDNSRSNDGPVPIIYNEFSNKPMSTHTPIKTFIDEYPDKWKSYFKFCFCRNPYDRMVSWWFTCKQLGYKEGNMSLKEFINHKKGSSQLKYITIDKTYEGEIEMDEILRFEDYEEELQRISKKLGFTLEENKNIHGTKRKHYSYYYDEECKQLIEKYFKKELELFNYSFEKIEEKSKWSCQKGFKFKNNFYYKK